MERRGTADARQAPGGGRRRGDGRRCHGLGPAFAAPNRAEYPAVEDGGMSENTMLSNCAVHSARAKLN